MRSPYTLEEWKGFFYSGYHYSAIEILPHSAQKLTGVSAQAPSFSYGVKRLTVNY